MKIRSIRPLFVTLLLGSSFAFSAKAVTLFTETMGTPSATTGIVAYNTAHNFDNDSLTFSGTGDVRTSSASSGYVGASAGGNVFLTNNGTSTFIISGIDTRGYTAGSLDISFGAFKSTIASNMTELVVEWQTTGSLTWNTLPFSAQPTGSGTANWRLISITGTSIAIDDDVSIRFTNSSTTPQFRLDDIKLSGVAAPIPEPSSAAAILGGLALTGVVIQRRRRQAVVKAV